MWQPIETAPKDGTKILICKEGWDFAPIAAWDWIDVEGEGSCWGWMLTDSDMQIPFAVDQGFVGWNEDREDGAMPTHWAPIIGATASTTPETGTEKVAAEVVQPIREKLKTSSPTPSREAGSQ